MGSCSSCFSGIARLEQIPSSGEAPSFVRRVLRRLSIGDPAPVNDVATRAYLSEQVRVYGAKLQLLECSKEGISDAELQETKLKLSHYNRLNMRYKGASG
eukprot:GEMP01041993.1.p2 GENE.GEMP01041993.1~~GEMP01041993.1.p2  ORF type:complete len:100 (+),score=17.36 GEMP01041993.1:81-380(+)